jgi:putative phosphoribosyl transferase
MIRPIFRNRAHAGQILAQRILAQRILAQGIKVTSARPLVLALPRGGVPVAAEVARTLDADLDVFVVRKLGVPGQEELAMGAIASGGAQVLNEALIRRLEISSEELDEIVVREEREIARREALYRGNRLPLSIEGRPVILVDDGLATGASMLAAVHAVKTHNPASVMVAVPVAPTNACDDLRGQVDEIVCAYMPEPFNSVGSWYMDFSQTTDAEVRNALMTPIKKSTLPKSPEP